MYTSILGARFGQQREGDCAFLFYKTDHIQTIG